MKMLNSLFLLLIFTLTVNITYAQSFKVFGTITKYDANTPVEGHWVVLNVNVDSLITQTDRNGYYEFSYESGDSAWVSVSTFDPCFGVVSMQWVSQNNPAFEANFTICTDTMPGCQAMFSYYGGTNLDSIMYSNDSSQFLSVNFIDQSFGNPTSWSWDFGDGTGATEQNPVHQYTESGYKTVTLTIHSSDCESVYSETILVGQPSWDCNSKFGYEIIGTSPDSSVTGYKVIFFDYSYPNPTQWSWDFGDGSASSEQNPVHFYTNPGFYNVSLVSGNNTCTSSFYQYLSLGDTIITDTACNAMFIYYAEGNSTGDSIQPNEGYTYYFENLSTGNFQNVLWYFGDGSASEDFSTVHTFTSPGEYIVTLNLLGDCNSSFSQWISVGTNDTVNGCFAIFYPVVSGNCVSFFNKSVGSIDSSFWDFGDGNMSTELNPYHCYESEGLYTVSLTIVNEVCSAIFYSEVYVGAQYGDSSLSAFFIPVIDGTYVNFINQSVGDIANYHWNFGDGQTSDLQNVEHTYNQLGIYIVTLGIGNANEVTTYTLEIDLNTGTFKGLVYDATGITDKHENLSLSVYPNPVNETANFELNCSSNSEAIISITTITGQVVYSANIELVTGENPIELDTQSLPSGIFILKVLAGSDVYVSKIFK